MIVYRDIISGDEMLSDAFKLEEVIDSEGNKVSRRVRAFTFKNISYFTNSISFNFIRSRVS